MSWAAAAAARTWRPATRGAGTDAPSRSPMVWSILNDLVISNADIYNLTARFVENGNSAYDAACGFLKDTEAWKRQVTCGRGETLNVEHNLCEMCPPGTYNEWMHAQYCEPSPLGSYNNKYGGVFPVSACGCAGKGGGLTKKRSCAPSGRTPQRRGSENALVGESWDIVNADREPY